MFKKLNIKFLFVISLISTVVLLFVVESKINNHLKYKNCFYDPILFEIKNITHYFKINDTLNKLATFVDSFSIDFLFLSLGIIFVIIKGKVVIIVQLGVFYVFKGLIYNLFLFPNSKYYIFKSPGFPSIMVKYHKFNDLFYSGHIGGTLILMTFFKNKKKFFKIYSIFTFIFTFLFLIIFNIHYTFDIILGLMYSIYSIKIINNNKYFLLNIFLNLYINCFKRLDCRKINEKNWID